MIRVEALRSVFNGANQQVYEHFACLGDIVRYVADPVECLQMVRALECPVVRGNHAEDAASESSLGDVYPLARKAML